jgi:small subunit ribosomal protein S20
MANHRSAEKRIRSSQAKKETNHYQAKTVRNAVKKQRSTDEVEEVKKNLPVVISKLDKLAKKKVIHKNKAANLKSKLMKQANTAGTKPKTESKTKSKAKAKAE